MLPMVLERMLLSLGVFMQSLSMFTFGRGGTDWRRFRRWRAVRVELHVEPFQAADEYARLRRRLGAVSRHTTAGGRPPVWTRIARRYYFAARWRHPMWRGIAENSGSSRPSGRFRPDRKSTRLNSSHVK